MPFVPIGVVVAVTVVVVDVVVVVVVDGVVPVVMLLLEPLPVAVAVDVLVVQLVWYKLETFGKLAIAYPQEMANSFFFPISRLPPTKYFDFVSSKDKPIPAQGPAFHPLSNTQ